MLTEERAQGIPELIGAWSVLLAASAKLKYWPGQTFVWMLVVGEEVVGPNEWAGVATARHCSLILRLLTARDRSDNLLRV